MTITAKNIERTHDGALFKVDVLRWTDERGRLVEREVVRHPGAVLVLPVLNKSRIVMIRNFRVAVDEQLWELPAGKLEQGEAPQVAAGRELEEETGYTAGSITPLIEFYTSPGFADELMHVFVAERLTKVQQRLEPGEQIEVNVVTIDEAMQMADRGEIRDAKTLVALLLWQRRLERAIGS